MIETNMVEAFDYIDFLDGFLNINPKSLSLSQRRKKRQQYAKIQNLQRFKMVFLRLFSIAMNARYDIEGLPSTCSERVVKQALICGKVVFFKLPNKYGDAVFALPGVESGKGFNFNGDALAAWVYSKNGRLNEQIDLFIEGADDSEVLKEGYSEFNKATNPKGVMVYENKMRAPFLDVIEYFSKAIADKYRTIDVCSMWMKQPFMPVCDEEMAQSILEAVDAVENNESIVPISSKDGFSIEKVMFEPIAGKSEDAKTAIEILDWYTQQFYSFCNLKNNTQVDKKGENLTTDEINMNDDITSALYQCNLDYLNQQLEFVNKMLGTNMKAVPCVVEVEKEGESDDDTGLE